MVAIDSPDVVPRARAARSSGTAETLFLLLIVLMPFIATPLMAVRIFDVPGMKIPNFVAACTLFAFLADGKLWRTTDRLQRGALIAFSVFIAVFVVAFLRSLPNVARFHALFPDSFQSGIVEYWQSYFVVPLLFAASFVYVLQRMCSREGMLNIVNAIGLSMFVLSCAVLLVMMSHPAAIMDLDPSRTSVNHLTVGYLGMDYNGAGTMYVVTGPLLLFMALKRGSLWTFNFALALVAVLLLKSRTALVVFVAMNAMTLLALGRARTLVAVAPLIAACALAVLGRVLIHLLSMGITKSGISTFALFSGREQAIWLPLLAEWISDPWRLLFGTGLFGVMSSNFLYSARSIFGAGQAHNFYLEFFLDNGIVMFALFMAVLTVWLVWSWRLGRRIQSQLYWVFFLCAVSFLIAGFTGRRYFPEPENLLLFPILAALINAARLKLRDGNARAVAHGRDRDGNAAG